MSKRSVWCEFSNEERKYMKKREGGKCVICHSSGALQAMHIFVSRAKGGRGVRTNGAMGCCKCHRIMDNPLGTKENELSKEYKAYCEKYLIEKENIKDVKELKKELTYQKEIVAFEVKKRVADKCKNCIYLVKNKNKSTTIPSYYCKYRKICINKTTKACGKYVNRYIA